MKVEQTKPIDDIKKQPDGAGKIPFLFIKLTAHSLQYPEYFGFTIAPVFRVEHYNIA